MFFIYSLTPAPWGDDYRFVEGFDREVDAKKVLKALESVNISFNLYQIVDMREPKRTQILPILGTVTGRLSSKKPNRSNTPKSMPTKRTFKKSPLSSYTNLDLPRK